MRSMRQMSPRAQLLTVPRAVTLIQGRSFAASFRLLPHVFSEKSEGRCFTCLRGSISPFHSDTYLLCATPPIGLTDLLETLQVFSTCSEDMHVVWTLDYFLSLFTFGHKP